MNSFDLIFYVALAMAVVTGFKNGLLRSAATILAYLLAAPLAVWAVSVIAPVEGDRPASPLLQNWVLFFGAFLAIGLVLGHVARSVLNDAIGSGVGIGDRLAGAALGALRVGLIATTLVLIFDQLVPSDREPRFLAGSHLRPAFSAAGHMGFRSLPPEAAAAVDRLKKERRI